MLINLPDPLFLVRSLTHEFCVQHWSWSKKGGMQKGGLVYWVSKFFWSWSKKREMRKGGWVRKGWVQSSSAPGCEKKFSGASRPHPPKKNPEYAPAHNIFQCFCDFSFFSCMNQAKIMHFSGSKHLFMTNFNFEYWSRLLIRNLEKGLKHLSWLEGF